MVEQEGGGNGPAAGVRLMFVAGEARGGAGQRQPVEEEVRRLITVNSGPGLAVGEPAADPIARRSLPFLFSHSFRSI